MTVVVVKRRPTVVKVVEREVIVTSRRGDQGPPGPAGPSWRRETPVGDIDGVNVVFSTSTGYVPETTVVYLNGLAQVTPDDYAEVAPNELALTDPPLPGDRLLVLYMEA